MNEVINIFCFLILTYILLLLKSYSIWHRLYDDSCEKATDDYRKKSLMKIKISFCVLVHLSTLRYLNLCVELSRDEIVIIIICHCVYWVYEITLRDKLLDQFRRQRKLF
jgi:small-conductance mechanosensitive channel